MVHRDLKLENVLVGQNLELKVADFGFSSDKRVYNLSTKLGSPTYQAPEISERNYYDGRKVDVFAMGVMLFVMV